MKDSWQIRVYMYLSNVRMLGRLPACYNEQIMAGCWSQRIGPIEVLDVLLTWLATVVSAYVVGRTASGGYISDLEPGLS